MKQILFKISSHDDSFLDLYEGLAWNLGDQGTVYTPHPLIPPNARMAIPIPTEIVVALKLVDAFTTVHQSMQDYLKHNEERELTLEKEDKTVTITGRSLPEVNTLINKLMPGLGRSKK